MQKPFNLKNLGLLLMVLFTAKLLALPSTWIDLAALFIGLRCLLKGFEFEKQPKIKAQEDIETLEACLEDFRQYSFKTHEDTLAQMADLKKVSEEAKKLMSQTNIANAFVPRRKMGDG